MIPFPFQAGGLGRAMAADPTWQTVLNWTPTTNSTGWSGFTVRQRINQSRLVGGSQARLTIDTTGFPLNMSKLYIGQEAAGGGYDFNATPAQVLFGGSPSIATAGGVFVSDVVSLSQNANRPIIISAYFNSTTTLRRTPSVATEKYGYIAGDQANVVDWSGFSESVTEQLNLVTKIEIQ